MDIVTDSAGNVKTWKITYCGWITEGELLDKQNPFKTAYVSAETAEDAIKVLRAELKLPEIDICSKPELELISKEDYEER